MDKSVREVWKDSRGLPWSAVCNDITKMFRASADAEQELQGPCAVAGVGLNWVISVYKVKIPVRVCQAGLYISAELHHAASVTRGGENLGSAELDVSRKNKWGWGLPPPLRFGNTLWCRRPVAGIPTMTGKERCQYKIATGLGGSHRRFGNTGDGTRQ